MRLLALLFAGLLIASVAAAQPAKRSAVAKAVGASGTLLRREADTRPWQLVADNETLHAGDLLVAGAGAELEGTNGAVRLVLQGGAGASSPLPIIESAVRINASQDGDLDFSLLRGRVDVVNRKAKGEAKVHVRGRDGTLELRLLEPGTRVALVLSGRWPPGTPFLKDAKPQEHKPALAFILLVLQGEIELKTAKHQFSMRAPPGPAILDGDDVADVDATPRRLEQLPAWATAKSDTEDAKNVKAALDRFRDLAKKKSVPEALDELLKSDHLAERRVAVAMLGATDDLERLAQALAAARTPDIWENGVPVVRHWIGREPGQDQKLYQGLVDKHKLSATQAETVLELLHGYSDDALRQPETYEGLLDLMESDQLAIRGLAHWTLYRLVPPGRKFGFDPLATPEKRAQAVREWRKLIPTGKLPPSK
ncbi:MAG: hypothetical protein K2R98_27385 [Gemmataceae bacterium]|nr:hypothetical protein [Gemmataceae bacterium]